MDIHKIYAWLRLGVFDIQGRYRRTVLGPFWLTFSTAISVGSLGILYGTLFKQDLKDFFPYISAGIIIWTFIASIILEGAVLFVSYKHIIQNMKINPAHMMYRVIARSALIFAHNSIVFLIVAIYFHIPLHISTACVIPAFILLLVNGYAVGVIIAYLASRFRDVYPLITALMSVLFLVTPILWYPSLLASREYFASYNPLTHYVAILREPMLGNAPSVETVVVVLVGTAVFSLVAFLVHRKNKNKLVYWL